MKLKKMNRVIIVLILLAVFFGGCSENKKTDGFYAMGSYIQVTAYGAETTLLESIKADIIKADESISHRIENSYISLLNKEKTAAFDTETYNMLYKAVEFCGNSSGVFDISILSLTALWDFDSETHVVPTVASIETALEKVGYENIQFGENNTVTIHGDMMLDLGALGKGYACDLAIQQLKEAGINGIVVVGGSVGVNGMKPGNEYFLVGIRNPFSEVTTDTFAGITLQSGFVSTSGSYEKCFTVENVFYHHILDIQTGYPVENELISVSVVCDNGMYSDMLSTACFALGIDKSLPLLEKYNAEAIFVTKEQKVVITEGLKNLVSIYADFEVETL